ncbi:MAG TPA: putative maltokinase [Candidatus Acidoferrales bacterium]|nr:putative maltokinase [Candidatus Acidoferrales bacterium]
MSAPSRSMIWSSSKDELQRALPDFLKARRWFGGKTRVIRSVEIADAIPIPHPAVAAAILVARVNYAEGPSESYTVPLLEDAAPPAADSIDDSARLRIRSDDGTEHVFSDALASQVILETLFDAIREARRFPGRAGELVGVPARSLEPLRTAAQGNLQPSLMKAEQSNSSVLYGRAFVLKLFRRLEAGISPDFEIGRFLSERTPFPNIPPMSGVLEYQKSEGEPAAMALLQGFVANQGDAWGHTLKALMDYYDRVAGGDKQRPDSKLLGDYGSEAALLGQRTAELHAALASDPSDPAFAPEPFSAAHQREISDTMVPAVHEIFGMLRRRAPDLPEHARPVAARVLATEEILKDRFRSFAGRTLTGPRIRIHGDLHLGQVLFTGNDFVFIDFEGEPARTLAERREKHSPMRDVAGMVRSFHYAAYAALFSRPGAAGAKSNPLVGFANAWYRAACDEFLRAYFSRASNASFLPAGSDEREFLLNFWLLGKAVYELKYELNHRLDWVAIPLEGIDGLIGGAAVS